MLRASRAITSSGAAFWLIPAIRSNERRGPGMVAVAGSGATMRSWAAGGPAGKALRTRGAQTNATTTNRAARRRKYLIAGTHPDRLRDTVPQLQARLAGTNCMARFALAEGLSRNQDPSLDGGSDLRLVHPTLLRLQAQCIGRWPSKVRRPRGMAKIWCCAAGAPALDVRCA